MQADSLQFSAKHECGVMSNLMTPQNWRKLHFLFPKKTDIIWLGCQETPTHKKIQLICGWLQRCLLWPIQLDKFLQYLSSQQTHFPRNVLWPPHNACKCTNNPSLRKKGFCLQKPRHFHGWGVNQEQLFLEMHPQTRCCSPVSKVISCVLISFRSHIICDSSHFSYYCQHMGPAQFKRGCLN
jgi:hypothetical protein